MYINIYTGPNLRNEKMIRNFCAIAMHFDKVIRNCESYNKCVQKKEGIFAMRTKKAIRNSHKKGIFAKSDSQIN